MSGNWGSGFSLLQGHSSMRNPGFLENRADAPKAPSFIKTDDRDLGVKIDFVRTVLLCRYDGPFQ